MWWLILFLSLISTASPPQTYMARVVRIIDGDTFDVLDSNNHLLRIRMNGIDAPEKGQAFGTRAKEKLAALCGAKTIRIVPFRKDRNGRWIADSFLGQTSLSAAMIREGMAWHFKKYSSDTTLAQLEQQARQKKIGLWSDPAPVAPWEYRAGRRTRSSQVASLLR